MPDWARLACFCLALSLEVIESIVALLLLKASTELFNLLLYRPVCYELVSSELFSMLVPHCRAQVSSKLTSIHTHSLWLEIEEGVSTGAHTQHKHQRWPELCSFGLWQLNCLFSLDRGRVYTTHVPTIRYT